MSKAIKIENLSKQYRLGLVGTGTISHDLNRWWAKIRGKEDPYSKVGQVNKRDEASSSDYVWALKDINLEVEQGEVLGIIGANGAGKSTLLKLISRITSPTSGSIKAKGRIACLLEVGTGMHPEMTARENLYLNGSVLGMRRSEISKKLDDIIDFAGCRMYVDTAVKRFSSGMRVRLGFAVAAFLEPEILIVDEVLAVGDAEFQNRAIGKMKEVTSRQGRTILFVSHNMASIGRLCTRCITLENGSISGDGPTDVITEKYLASASRLQEFSLPVSDRNCTLRELSLDYSEGEYIVNSLVDSNANIARLGVGVEICTVSGKVLGRISPRTTGNIANVKSQESHAFSLRIKSLERLLNPGTYQLNFFISNVGVEEIFRIDAFCSFELSSNLKPSSNANSSPLRIENSFHSEKLQRTSRNSLKQGIFVSGCGHSGTSLMLKLLGNHENLHSIPYESNLGALSEDLAASFDEFDQAAKMAGKERWVEKTPKHVYQISKLVGHLENAKFILMRRDGRDVVASLLARGLSIEKAIQRWRDDNLEVDKWTDNSFVKLVKYEDLIANTEVTIRGVLDFLNEEYTEDCLRPELKPSLFFNVQKIQKVEYGKSTHENYRNWQINQPLFDGRGRWKMDLSNAQVKKVFSELGDQLEKYGYLDSGSNNDSDERH